ncbi:MAG: peptidylprolyl isomerase [Bacteroidaceae bacterium]|nr:peptidylprolyl isomerase [Bacteroidaceae bacterium]
MKINKYLLIILTLSFICMSCEMKKNTASKQLTNVNVKIETTMGTVVVKLYDETPAHRDNFVKLVNEGYYDGTLFHRVIKEFMIQGGDGDSRTAKPGQMLGTGDPGYKIPAEFVYPKYFHKKGALAAARQGDDTNPEKASSGSQFYIVTGAVFPEGRLKELTRQMQMQREHNIFNSLAMARREEIMNLRRNRDQAGLMALQEQLIAEAKQQAAAQAPITFTPEQIEAYTTVGGAPHLDGEYTVFGEVVEGMEVVDKIEKVKTGAADRPVEDVKVISMKIVEK